MNYAKNISRRINVKRMLVEFGCVFSCALLALLLVRSLSGLPAALSFCAMLALVIAVIQIAVHASLDGYSASWRFFSVQDASIASISSTVGVVIAALIFAASVPLAGWAIVLAGATAGSVGPRLFTRLTNRTNMPRRYRPGTAHVRGKEDDRAALLIIGFGDQVADFIRSQGRNGKDYRIVGIVHLDKTCEANSLRGVPVLGSVDKLRAIVRLLTSQENRPDFLVMTRDEMNNRSVAEVLSITDKIGIPVAWLPQSPHRP
jgi:FlaA1/EpsC-like NDP-sugar epimerase